MKVLLDTNVLISGVFFGGVPGRILEAWRDGKVHLVIYRSSTGRIRPKIP